MKKLTLTVAGIAIITAMLAPSPAARAQTAPRFEYLLASPYQKSTAGTTDTGTPITRWRWAGYRACAATGTEWTCREFENTVQPFPGLSAALSTLGNEGWDLVRSVDDRRDPNSYLGGETYLFKRQRQ